MGSPSVGDPIQQVVSASAVECMDAMDLVIYCSWKISGCNNLSGYQIKTPQVERVGLLSATIFPL